MLTRFKLALLIASPLVAGAATIAAAHGGPDGKPASIEKFDANHDGTLDDAERAQMKAAWQAKRAERKQAALATYDANHDGTLDDAERARMKEDRLAKKFTALDKNGDGAISLDEFKAGTQDGRHGRHGRFHHRGMKP